MHEGHDVTISVSSLGGEVLPVLELIHAARETGRELTVYGSVVCASAASLLLAGATRSYMAPGGAVMVHAPWSFGVGTADELRDQADSLDLVREAMNEVYVAGAERRGKQSAWVAEMQGDNWMNGNDSVDLGIVDAVGEATPAPVEPEAEAPEQECVEETVEIEADAQSDLEAVRAELASIQGEIDTMKAALKDKEETIQHLAGELETARGELAAVNGELAKRDEAAREEQRVEAVADAVRTGRIAPAAKEGWLAALRRDESMAAVLAELPVSLPVARKIAEEDESGKADLASRFAKVMQNG